LVPGARGPLVVLASRSPQRRAILEQLGIEFEVRPADVEEDTEGDPADVVLRNARRKAHAVEGDTVLGVDTEVYLDGHVFGKPQDEAQARRDLERLSGRTHEVFSGLVLVHEGAESSATARTEVTFRGLDAPLIEWYLRGAEWRDRAGGYAVQGRGAALVASIEGDYWNVVGLPVALLLDLAPWLLENRLDP
jgi:septum formation protein